MNSIIDEKPADRKIGSYFSEFLDINFRDY